MNKKLLIGIIAGVVAIGAVVGGMFLFKHEHTEAVDGAIAPTCLETGLTEGKHCSVCNEIIVEQETVAVLGHNMVTDSAVAPTCEATGLTEGSHCSRCDYKVAQAEIPALGHTEKVKPEVKPTCTETGLTKGKYCSVCNKVLVAQTVVEPLGHNYVDNVCTVCKDTLGIAGDLDGNEAVNTSDVIYLLMHTYFPDAYPVEQDSDYTGDGVINTQDVIYLLMHTYFPDAYPIEFKVKRKEE